MSRLPLRAGLACGLLAAPLWALAIVLCGARLDGFDHAARYISELGARGAATEILMRYLGFLPAGLLHLGFAAALGALHRGQRAASTAALLLALNGLGRVGAGFFPCDPGCAGAGPGQAWHQGFATLGFLSLLGATLAWALHCRAGKDRAMGAFSLACGALGLVFLLLMKADGGLAGLWERLSSGVLSAWVWVLALALWRRMPALRG